MACNFLFVLWDLSGGKHENITKQGPALDTLANAKQREYFMMHAQECFW